MSEDLFYLINSVDPDKMQHYAAFYLSIHCNITRSVVCRIQRVMTSQSSGCHGLICDNGIFRPSFFFFLQVTFLLSALLSVVVKVTNIANRYGLGSDLEELSDQGS